MKGIGLWYGCGNPDESRVRGVKTGNFYRKVNVYGMKGIGLWYER